MNFKMNLFGTGGQMELRKVRHAKKHFSFVFKHEVLVEKRE